MRVMKFAVGLAAGYVLGSRAGRGAYDQLVSAVGQARGQSGAAEKQQTSDETPGAASDDTPGAASDALPGTASDALPATETVQVLVADPALPPAIEEATLADPEPVLPPVIDEPTLTDVELALPPAIDEPTLADAEPAVTAVPRPPRKRTKGTVTSPSVTTEDPLTSDLP